MFGKHWNEYQKTWPVIAVEFPEDSQDVTWVKECMIIYRAVFTYFQLRLNMTPFIRNVFWGIASRNIGSRLVPKVSEITPKIKHMAKKKNKWILNNAYSIW